MNKLLSKEQAEWLIRQIYKESWKYSVPGKMGCTSALYTFDAKEIINQCTEKEFPFFKISNISTAAAAIIDPDFQVNVSVRSHCITNEPTLIICPQLNPDKSESAIRFTFEQFKQFTQGCIKIVEYLDDISNGQV